MTKEEIIKINNAKALHEMADKKSYLLADNQPKSKPHAVGYEILLEDFSIKWQGKTFTVPKGFIWDGASIPRIAWRVIGHPFMQEFRAPTLLHDMLYDTALLSRKDADLAMKELLIANGVSKARASAMYAAVRTGGLVPWNKHRRLQSLIK